MSTIIYLFKIYRKHLNNKIWILLLLSLFIAALDGIGISMLMPLLESVEIAKGVDKTNWLFKITQILGVYGSLKGVLLFMFGVFLFKAIARFSMGWFQANLNRALQLKLKKQMYQDVLEVDYRYYLKHNTGHFITVLNTHLVSLINSFNSFVQFVTALIMTLTYMVMAAVLSWQVAIISLIIGSIVIGLLSYVVKYIKNLSRKSANVDKKNSQIAIQAIYAFKYVVSTSSYAPIQKLFNDSITKISLLTFKTQIAQSFIRSLQELVTVSLLISLILVEVVWMKQPITAVFVVLLLFYRGINQMLNIQNNYQTLISQIGNIESAENELQNLQKYKAVSGNIVVQKPLNSESIFFEGVYQKYRDQSDYVLQDVHMEIPKNQTVALVGPSGAGKSTMVDILTGLLKPTKGYVLFDSIPLREIDYRSWRSRIGYVNQDVMLFDDTLWNNITMFDPEATEEQIKKACLSANIWEFVSGTEEGLQTKIGDRGIRLSGGQRQRLSIARELYKQPDLLILDEATSALDAESESVIKEAIESLKGKMTVVIIAHRLSTIKDADKVYVMDKGKIVESGSYTELIQSKNKFHQMVEMQSL
jgi:subfamily B ATP-binding cassette protein MsbA